MNIKKFAVLTGMLSVVPCLFGFTDLPEDHWAYDAVQSLVADGTVSGFEDGTFRPNEPVTRAQLVKMVGVTGEVRNDYVSDLKRRHWAYDILRRSKLRTIDNQLLPDTAATREQVAQYMYDCYGDNETAYAPSVVTRNINSQKEVSWVYDHGIMVGDDGINLRLDDSLTRAEAAVLISNSRNQIDKTKDFADNVSPEMLERVFNNSGLFEAPYQADKVLTNGEAARAAYKLYLGISESLYYPEEADFEHEYANDLKAMESVLGEGRISAEFADSEAMPEDTFAMFAFAMASKITPTPSYGTTGNYYTDAVLSSKTLDAPLTFAFGNGVYPFGGGKLNTGTPVTHKTIAAALLQYDMLWGLQTSVTVNSETSSYNDEPMRYTSLPENEELFKGILSSVPNDVYMMPFILSEGIEMQEGVYPVSGYAFYNDLKDAFAARLAQWSKAIYDEYGVKAEFTFYPQLVYDNGGGFTVRTKAQIKDAGSNPPAVNVIFPDNDDTSPVSAGTTVWTEPELDYMFFTQ